MSRSLQKWIVPLGCVLAVIVLGTLLLTVRTRTLVTVVSNRAGLYCEVNGARLDVPAEDITDTTTGKPWFPLAPAPDGVAVAPPDGSQYWQPGSPGALSFIGKIGEGLQSLRPSAHWEALRSPGSSGNAQQQTYQFELVAGRTPSTVTLASKVPGAPTYALQVHPEGRTLTWFKRDAAGHVDQVARGYYRPLGRTSSLDLFSEMLLAAIAAAALCLLAWAAGLLPSSRKEEDRASLASGLPRLGTYAVPLALFLAGTIAAAATALYVLDAVPHVQDEVGYLFQGKIFALGRSYVPTPPGPEFFANGFIQMFEGKWFAKYPPGFPLLLIPGMWSGLPWLINPLCAGVSLALVYASGVKMFGRHVGVWAGLIGLVSPWVIFMSASYMSHPSTMMWSALFLYGIVCTHMSAETASGRFPLISRFGWPTVAGFALGMAFITRQWTAAGIGAGVALWALGDIVFTPGRARLDKFTRYLFVVVGMLPPVLFILYENKQLTGDWLRFTQDLVGSYDRPGFGPGHGDAQGHTPALGVYNALVYVRSLGSMFDGWPVPLALAPLVLGVFAWVGEKGKRALGWDMLLWLGTLGLVGAYFVWWSATTIYGPRYWYEAMPFMLLMAGRGMDLLGRIASGVLNGTSGRAIRWAFPGAVFALLTVYTLSQGIPNGVIEYTDYNGISATALRNAESAHLKNALVFAALDPAKPNRDYGKVFAANDPLLRGDVVYARDLGVKRNKGLLNYFPGRQPYWLPLDGPPQPGFGPG